MGKKLAIKGHPTRGKEVIELLEMMGGVNSDEAYGNLPNKWNVSYYIFKDGVIKLREDKIFTKKQFEIFTLEEFLEKYPFKVGDVIKFPNNMAEKIAEMKWDEELEDIIYTSVSNCIRTCHIPKNKEEKKINQMSLANCDLDKVEIVLGDKFELKIEDGKYYAVRKKSKYPTTYDECCEVLDYCGDYFLTTYDNNGNPSIISNILNSINILTKLLICRDAYWKIAGDEMGLNGPWKPDWKNEEQYKYCIYYTDDNIQKGTWFIDSSILAFPTQEMRDVFYENFKDLIESCKELL